VRPTIFGTRAYPLFVAVAVVVGVAASFRGARQARLSAGRWLVFQLVLAASALLGAKLYHFWEQGELETLTVARLLSQREGFRYPGGLLAALPVLLLARPIVAAPIAVLADATAPAIAVAMAIVRVGCFLQGCCFGIVTSLPWGISFPRYSPAWDAHLERGWIGLDAPWSLPVHPLEIYFGVWSAAVAVTLVAVERRKPPPGQLFLMFLLLHEGGKASLELLRVPFNASLQLTSLAAAVVAGGWLLARWIRRAPSLGGSRPAEVR
jgi:phosphatidylglycerol:prolipoprotein diacylglycerol transferase